MSGTFSSGSPYPKCSSSSLTLREVVAVGRTTSGDKPASPSECLDGTICGQPPPGLGESAAGCPQTVPAPAISQSLRRDTAVRYPQTRTVVHTPTPLIPRFLGGYPQFGP